MRGAVTCPEYLAAFAGAEILKAGGNAIDAAIATAFAQGVVGPKLSGIGGIGVMTTFTSTNRCAGCIRFWGIAGSKARPDEFVPELIRDAKGDVSGVRNHGNAVGYRSVLVPGFVRGMSEAYLQYGSGRISWPALLAPAVRLAANGFPVDDYLYRFWRHDTPVEDVAPPLVTLTATSACAAIYTRDGEVYRPGERLVQADYARTLGALSAGGAAVFYEGEIGTRIAQDMEQNGGLFTADDLRRYRALSGEPLRGTYHGHELITDPPPGSGALVIEILNILETFDLSSLGWNTARYLDVLARVFRYVFTDRRRFMADPRYADVPVGVLTSKDYAKEVAGKVLRTPLPSASASAGQHEGTTHVSALDEDGNAAAITHTVCDSSGVVTPGLGFMYNNDMQSFDPVPGRPNSIAPGKSPVNGGAPTILLKDGEAILAIGSPAGPRKVTAIVQTMVNMIDFGMDIEAALAADRIHQEVGPLMVEHTFPRSVARHLEQLGHNVQATGYTARVAAVYRQRDGGRFIGATDPRGGKGKAIVEQ